jgi:hypothetical protein
MPQPPENTHTPTRASAHAPARINARHN